MSVYKLYADGTGGTEDGIAQLDIQFVGIINAILLGIQADVDADGEVARGELSFISTNAVANNDTRGSLAMVGQRAIGTVADISSSVVSIPGINIPVNAGERLWLHIVAAASVVSNCWAYVYVDDGGEDLRRRR